jgi:phage tail sheath protein FI
MPTTPTYPGVYIEELPSAVRTIIGVPTSIAAFVGWAPRGPAGAYHITSWDDYQRIYGGLHASSPMSQAVYQFYQNGGSEAEIVRLAGKAGGAATAATIQLGPDDNAPTLHAVSVGSWGNNLRVRVDYLTKDPTDNKLYNLTVRDTATGAQETYLNVSTDANDARSLDNVLASSDLVKATANQTTRPKNDVDVPVGQDPFADGHSQAEEPAHPRWYTQATKDSGKDDPDVGTADYIGGAGDNFSLNKQGIYALLTTDIFNMLCLPGRADDNSVLSAALQLCGDRRAMLLVDPPSAWASVNAAATTEHALKGDAAKNAAVYFPNVMVPNPLKNGAVDEFPPCGVMAGVWGRTDVQRGVWKAPAGTDASLNGANSLKVKMTDGDNGRLNPLGVNCLRTFPVIGHVSWGARTMRGADRLADQWKYVPVRRLALFIEESLYRGTQWVVFEPNDEPLWSSIRLNVGAFMNNLFRQGAFQGRTPQEAYLVKCDSTNNPQNSIDRGIVNILVGFAPLKPAEFVIIQIQQLAGQIQV